MATKDPAPTSSHVVAGQYDALSIRYPDSVTHSPPMLPLPADIESVPVLRRLSAANRALAELKGVTRTMPNETILISTLSCRRPRTVRPSRTS